MKVLYITPYPPTRSGIADYAFIFKKSLIENTNTEIDTLPLRDKGHIYCDKFEYLMSIQRDVKKWRKYRTFDYGLVHVELGYHNNREFYYAWFIQQYLSELPIILTLHDPPLTVNNPMRFIGVEDKARPVRTFRRALNLTLGNLMEKRILQGARKVLIFTQKGKEAFKEKFKSYPEDQIFIIPQIAYNPSPLITGYKHNYYQNSAVILYLGLLGSSKGIDTLLKAYSLLLQRRGEFREKSELWIAGGDINKVQNNIGYELELAKLSSEFGISKKVRILGYIPDNQLDLTLKKATILILPHNPHKARSISGVLIRGMGLGLPIIASNVRAFPDEIKDGETGLLFEAGNPYNLLLKMEALLDSTELRMQLGTSAKKHILGEHAQEKIAKQMYVIYEKVIGGI
jgi:glycosyltransferase involved in cell wall biosynthesis